MRTNKPPRRMARPAYVGEAGGTDTDASQATPESSILPAEKRTTKQSLVIDLLHRDGGSSLAAIVEATGWLPHTARCLDRAAQKGTSDRAYVGRRGDPLRDRSGRQRVTRLEKDLMALAAMSPAQLRDQWLAAGTGGPPLVPPPLLRRLLAQRLQEKRHGGLPLLVVRELDRVAANGGAVPEPARKTVVLTAGTRLIREWNGKTIAVEVREGGFVWEERTFRSLSEIAKVVTGAHWSGPRFFGLRRNG